MISEAYSTHQHQTAETTPAVHDAGRWRRTTGPAWATPHTPPARPSWALPGRAPMIWARISDVAMAGLMTLMAAVIIWLVIADVPPLHKAIGVGAGTGVLASSIIALRKFGARADVTDERTEAHHADRAAEHQRQEERLSRIEEVQELILGSLSERAAENAELVPAVIGILDRLDGIAKAKASQVDGLIATLAELRRQAGMLAERSEAEWTYRKSQEERLERALTVIAAMEEKMEKLSDTMAAALVESWVANNPGKVSRISPRS